ncbi:hypothetical protein OIU77_016512 [Salix suchowensis]|uniref:Uncharacterized protein n=1 Tax=Salix suchowensis TaxID=1278906 RepID=A0ABQ8ZL60_9ROSI|nr:hypothetical protein OIU77_016512 [Salix suchowensis]
MALHYTTNLRKVFGQSNVIIVLILSWGTMKESMLFIYNSIPNDAILSC